MGQGPRDRHGHARQARLSHPWTPAPDRRRPRERALLVRQGRRGVRQIEERRVGNRGNRRGAETPHPRYARRRRDSNRHTPLATLDTVVPTPAARSLGAITAWAPAASATRRQAPRLCGSVTPAGTSRSGASLSESRRSSRPSRAGFSNAIATTPWWRPPP